MRYDFTPVTVNRQSKLDEQELAFHQIYQQVLERQPFESERQQLAKEEKDFLCNKIGVRRFLKAVASSDLYLETFYYLHSNYHFLDTCFKHFIGRAPINQEELRHYDSTLTVKGVNSVITLP